MKKLFLIILLVSFMSAASFSQIPVDSIHAIIKQEVNNKRCKSIIVGIVDSNGRQIFAEGVKSDADPNKPDGNTVYEIGSITKVFTSLLLSEMYLKHELDLKDPISKYLPKNIKTPSRNGKEITLLSLATHRSGMPRFPYNVSAKDLDQPYADYSSDKLYQYISTFQLPYDIDSRWNYSNVGYGVLGNILSLVAKKDFETLLIDEICEPLKLTNTTISLTAKQKLNMATGHAETGTAVGITNLGAISAGGSIRSTVNDLLTFAEANLGLKESLLFPAMELTHVSQAKKDGNDTYITMGWTLVNNGLLFKDGGMPGYTSFIGIDKKRKIGVVILSNSNNNVSDIGRHILEQNKNVEVYKYNWKLLDTLRETANSKGVEKAVSLYHQLKVSKSSSVVFDENQLNYLGNELRNQGKLKDAIKVFELNVTEYPKSVLVYESLGELYRVTRDNKKSASYFEKALELEPQNPHWSYLLGVVR